MKAETEIWQVSTPDGIYQADLQTLKQWVAKLRSMKTDKNPLLFKVNMGAGHGGASGRYDALRETAFDYAFMLTQMGVTQ